MIWVKRERVCCRVTRQWWLLVPANGRASSDMRLMLTDGSSFPRRACRQRGGFLTVLSSSSQCSVVAESGGSERGNVVKEKKHLELETDAH